MSKASSVPLLLLSLSACYTYTEPTTAPERAAAVRLRLAEPSEFRLTNLTANDVVLVDGEMIRAGSDSVLVSARWLQARSGYEFAGMGETVRVPRSNLVTLEKKRISLLKTVALAAGFVLTVGAASVLLGGVGDGGGGGGKGPPVEQ